MFCGISILSRGISVRRKLLAVKLKAVVAAVSLRLNCRGLPGEGLTAAQSRQLAEGGAFDGNTATLWVLGLINI